MGQFASRHYDGDPYIELMRALPDRELIWWVQKVIWLAEGLTFADHFWRTYPSLFLHKCLHCNGAGSMTCPSCKGFKRRGAAAAAAGAGGFRLSEMVGPRRRLGRAAGRDDCENCGAYCDWDDDSEWEEKWSTWESRLAYYDRTYGKLMDEWYEDVVNEGNLDMDTPHVEDEGPEPGETGLIHDTRRELIRRKKLMAALMKRYGGHPYERGDLVDFKMLDPAKTLKENLAAMGYNENELPPELNPSAFPELLIEADSALHQLDHQIRMEAILCRNMEAALQDRPKPYMLQPTAGTVPCPSCQGAPWYYSIAPNWKKMMRLEEPFWLATMARMNQYALHPAEAAASASRHFLEYPQASLGAAAAAAPLELHLEGVVARGKPRGAGWRAVAKGASPALVARCADAEELLLRGTPEGEARRAARAAAALSWWTPAGEPHPAYGSSDPLSEDELKALPIEELRQEAWQRSPLDGSTPLQRGDGWAAAAGMPGRRLAEKIRERRLEAGAEGTDLESALRDYERRRGRGGGGDGGPNEAASVAEAAAAAAAGQR